MRKEKDNILVTGWPVMWIKLKAGLALMSISFSTLRNSVKSLRTLSRLLGQRKRIHGNRRDHKIARSGNRYYWSIYIPGFPSIGFNQMIEQEIRRISAQDRREIPLQTLILSISSRCHYQCEHCFEGKNLKGWEQLTISDLVKVLREAISMGIPHIQIGGGEPLLRFKDLIRLLKMGKDHMEFWLATSGYGLTRDKAWDLKIAGLTGANISLDHWKEEKHNQFRNHPEAFRWALEAVENCKNVGILPCLTICITHDTAGQEQLMRYLTLARNLEVPFVRFLEARNVGNYEGKDVLLTDKEQQVIVDFILKMNGSRRNRTYPIIQYAGYHQRKIGCFGAGNRYIHIDAAGNYHSCPFCRGAAGNIKDMGLEKGISMLREKGCQLFTTNS